MAKHSTPRSAFEYTTERNRDLIEAYKIVLAESDIAFQQQIFKVTVKMPARRFWVSEERAVKVVKSMYHRSLPNNMSATKHSMYSEIKRRVDKVRECQPNWTLGHCIEFVVNQPAPEFYISEWTARNIISGIKGF